MLNNWYFIFCYYLKFLDWWVVQWNSGWLKLKYVYKKALFAQWHILAYFVVFSRVGGSSSCRVASLGLSCHRQRYNRSNTSWCLLYACYCSHCRSIIDGPLLFSKYCTKGMSIIVNKYFKTVILVNHYSNRPINRYFVS